MNFAIIGATGNVGRKTIEILEKSNIQISNLFLVASEKSKGKKIKLGYDISQIIKILNKNEKNGLNVAFGSFILIGKIYEAYNLKI